MGPGSGIGRVAVAGDTGVARRCLAAALAGAAACDVVEAASVPELVRALRQESVDIAVVDVYFGGRPDGVGAARSILTEHTGTAVLLWSAHPVAPDVVRLLREFGTRAGFLQKDSVDDIDALLDALHRLRQGELVVDPAVVRRMLAPPRPVSLSRLTPRERSVLRLLVQGLSNRGIAERLRVRERTVEDYVGQAFTKLDLPPPTPQTNRRVLAVRAWLRLVSEQGAPDLPVDEATF